MINKADQALLVIRTEPHNHDSPQKTIKKKNFSPLKRWYQMNLMYVVEDFR